MILVNPDSHSPNPRFASAIVNAWMKMKQLHVEMHGKWLCMVSWHVYDIHTHIMDFYMNDKIIYMMGFF